MQETDLQRPVCNECNMSWYRDFSMFFHGIRSIPVWLECLSGSRDLLS
jgi:hypothetical protein